MRKRDRQRAEGTIDRNGWNPSPAADRNARSLDTQILRDAVRRKTSNGGARIIHLLERLHCPHDCFPIRACWQGQHVDPIGGFETAQFEIAKVGCDRVRQLQRPVPLHTIR